jgi:hypothetical protein
MKNKLQIVTACIAAFACCAPAVASAATKKSPSPAASPSVTPSPKSTRSPAPQTAPAVAPKATPHPTIGRVVPFHGMVGSVDQKAKTFTIGKEKSRVFKVTDKTVLSKGGAPATMKDVVANEEVRGSYWKATDGTLEAKTVKLGPLTDVEKAGQEKKKAPKSETSATASPAASPSAPPTTAPSVSPSMAPKP